MQNQAKFFFVLLFIVWGTCSATESYENCEQKVAKVLLDSSALKPPYMDGFCTSPNQAVFLRSYGQNSEDFLVFAKLSSHFQIDSIIEPFMKFHKFDTIPDLRTMSRKDYSWDYSILRGGNVIGIADYKEQILVLGDWVLVKIDVKNQTMERILNFELAKISYRSESPIHYRTFPKKVLVEHDAFRILFKDESFVLVSEDSLLDYNIKDDLCFAYHFTGQEQKKIGVCKPE
jgi:hypothetical protein